MHHVACQPAGEEPSMQSDEARRENEALRALTGNH